VNREIPQLKKLLKEQIEHYRQALALEEELAGIIADRDFSRMAANTDRKNTLMPIIHETYEKLLSALESIRAENGTVPDAPTEKLRLESVSLLQKIEKVEKANLEAIQKQREDSAADLRQTRSARRAARGYRPQASRKHRFLDTKS
jgi:hypothetical protein